MRYAGCETVLIVYDDNRSGITDESEGDNRRANKTGSNVMHASLIRCR